MLPVLPVHQALVGIGPVYQKKFLSFKESGPYNLRSNASCELKVPKTKCETHGDRAFSHLLAPHCGTLSLKLSGVSNVQGFKQALNTFWFRLAFEKRIYTDASITVVNGCITCICSWLVVIYILRVRETSSSYLSASDSASGFPIIKKQHLSFFVAGQGTLVSCIFIFCFSINLQTSSCGCFVCLFFFPPDEIAFFSILRNDLKRFASGAILSFAKKNLSYLPILNWRLYIRSFIDCVHHHTRWTGGHFACACVNPLNDNSVGASNLMAGNRKLARKVTVLLRGSQWGSGFYG